MLDLRALIREVCETSTMADPTSIAREVEKLVSADELGEALAQALPAVVASVVSRMRGPIPSNSPDDQPVSDTQARAVGGRSSKVAGIRDAWARMLRDRVSVGPDPTQWKFLANCNAADLAYAAGLRRSHAAANAAAAQRFERLRQALDAHGVATVGELPPEALGEDPRAE
jgi:hypothetical protein